MRTLGIFLASVAVAVACGSSERATPFRPSTSGGSATGASANGGEGGDGPSGGSSSGGFAGAFGGGAGESSGGSGTGGASDSCPSDGAEAPTGTTFTCPTSLSFGAAATVDVDLAGGEVLFVSSDELFVLWRRLGSSALEYYFAERVTSADAFGPGVQILTSDRPIGVSSDGLRLALVSSDGQTLSEATRSALGEDFGASGAGDFNLLSLAASNGAFGFSEVVYGPSDQVLVYSTFAVGGGDGHLWLTSRSGGGAWPEGTALPSCEFDEKSSLFRRPVALSNDGLTLFFFDEVRGIGRAAYRVADDAPFSWFTDTPGRPRVTPNLDCSKIYFGTSGTLSVSSLNP